MSEEGFAIVGNEMGFLWEENECNWANNLSNNSSPTGGAGYTGTADEEEEEKSEGKKMKSSNGGGGPKANKGKEGAPQGNNKKKRSRGGITKEGKKVGGGESDHEIHIWTERERRKKMRNMFANLHALLPQLPPKADKSTIVDEAVNYIRTLQQTLQKLQKQKLEKLQGATTSSTTISSFNCEPSLISQQKVAYKDTREAFLADQGSCNELVTMGNNINNPSSNSLSVVSQFSPVMFQTWTSSNVVLNICGDQAHISICSPRKPGLLTSICYALEKHKITLVSAQISSDGDRNMYMIHAHHASNGASDQFLEAFNPVEEVFKQAVGEIMLWVSS
ncbi:transcription factor bHLH95 [Morus notabilis]|uniref:transcription factor bHLH95 n=1 Tax=Morus notabilis TaxID=981085 RepID=UPI000CECE918|nr:transcription factor bHLH95 [Morus notabilis]